MNFINNFVPMKRYFIIIVLFCLFGNLHPESFYRTRSNRYISDVAFSGTDHLLFVYTLMRIDLPTGKASPVLDLSGYPFAEMMRVHDRVLYFLYPTGNNHRQALFQVKLDDFYYF